MFKYVNYESFDLEKKIYSSVKTKKKMFEKFVEMSCKYRIYVLGFMLFYKENCLVRSCKIYLLDI